eukprot:SAG31_NODE_11326_length_1042_cov_0.958643_1_plen_62_part_00
MSNLGTIPDYSGHFVPDTVRFWTDAMGAESAARSGDWVLFLKILTVLARTPPIVPYFYKFR